MGCGGAGGPGGLFRGEMTQDGGIGLFEACRCGGMEVDRIDIGAPGCNWSLAKQRQELADSRV